MTLPSSVENRHWTNNYKYSKWRVRETRVGELSLNEWVEINQGKRAEEGFEGVGAASASEFSWICSTDVCVIPLGTLVFVCHWSVRTSQEGARHGTGELGRDLIPEALMCYFWECALYPVGKSHWEFKQISQMVLYFRRISSVRNGCAGMEKRAGLS